MDRRGFLGAGICASAAVGLIASCGEKSDARYPDPVVRGTGGTSGIGTMRPDAGNTMVTDAASGDAVAIADAGVADRTDPSDAAGFDSFPMTDGSVARDAPAPDVGTTAPPVEICSAPLESPKGFKSHPEDVDALAFHPSSSLIVSGGGLNSYPTASDYSVRIWSIPEGRLVAKKLAHGKEVSAVAISPDGKLAASGGWDHKIRLWTLPDGGEAGTLMEEGADYLAFTPDGATLISGMLTFDSRQALRFWSVADRTLLTTITTKLVEGLHVTPDGKYLVSYYSDQLAVWSIPDRTMVTMKQGTDVDSSALSPSGEILATGSTGPIKLWTVPGLVPIRELPLIAGSVTSLAFSADGSILYACQQGSLGMWNVADGRLLRQVKAPMNTDFGNLTVSPDGRYLVCGGYTDAIALWELGSTACPRFRGVLYDASASEGMASTYDLVDPVSGKTISYAIPCGTALPPNSTCTCNCVAGSYRPASGGGGGSTCTCNTVCTCIPVCQAHKLADSDGVVSRMAEALLIVMGPREQDYFAWAAQEAAPALSGTITRIAAEIHRGRVPDPEGWPTVDECRSRLCHSDPVIALMAAQLLTEHVRRRGVVLDEATTIEVRHRLAMAPAMHWRLRAAKSSTNALTA